MFKSLSKTYKDKLTFGEVKKGEEELFKKFNVQQSPALLALTDPSNFGAEVFDNLAEMKIDQIKKFLSKYAYKETKKEEKVLELHHLTKSKAQNPNTGICGRKTSNICLIIFVERQDQTPQFLPLLDKFSKDPVTLTYVLAQDEPQMMS